MCFAFPVKTSRRLLPSSTDTSTRRYQHNIPTLVIGSQSGHSTVRVLYFTVVVTTFEEMLMVYVLWVMNYGSLRKPCWPVRLPYQR